MIVITAHLASVSTALFPIGVPIRSPRTVSMKGVNGDGAYLAPTGELSSARLPWPLHRLTDVRDRI